MASLMWAALLLALFVPLSVRGYATARRCDQLPRKSLSPAK